MQESIAFAPDLRIVSDPLLPCWFSFICSIQKNIPAIHSLMNSIRQKWGPSYEFRGKRYYGFPTLETLSEVKVSDFRNLNAGYRSKFFVQTIGSMVKKEVVEKEVIEQDPESRIDFKDRSIRQKISDIDREIFAEDRDLLYKRVAVAHSLGNPKKPKKKGKKR